MENNLKQILRDNGFVFKKGYGQNFIFDEVVLEDIVEKSGIDKDTKVLEIGCGAGALTRCLSVKAKRVLGYEIDEKLKPVLAESLKNCGNVEVVFKDVLREGVKAIDGKFHSGYCLVANLPYYITTPLITEFLENSKKVKSLVIMVQEEVAKRLCAAPATADYGAITVAVNLRGSAKIIKLVKRENFFPVPNVDSAVVKIDMEADKFCDADFAAVRECVKAGFNNRRKMLVNNLMNFYKINRENAEKVLTLSGVSLSARGETLSAKDYVVLSENVKNLLKK